MKKQKPVSYAQRTSSSLFKAMGLVRNSVLVVISTLFGCLIYSSFQSSIDESFAPRPEQISDVSYRSSDVPDPDRVEDGIHVETGMIYDTHFALVRRSCTSCHSAKLVIQNRATRDGWKQMINWMQETQGLQDLGKYEVKILDYLEKNYAPKRTGRRKPLEMSNDDWYTIMLD